MSATPTKHAFISFSSRDEKLARAVCDEMERRKVPCWISSRDVRPGRNYQTEIIEGLRGARHLILLFSAHANASEEVARELALASKNHVRIYPVRVEEIEPSGGLEFMLATSQWVDAFRDWNDAMERLADELGGGTFVGRRLRIPWRFRRKPFLAAAAATLLVLLVGAGVLFFRPGAVSVHVPPRVATAAVVAPRPAPPAIVAAVEKLAASLQCAHVLVSPGVAGVSLSGFVGSAADEQRLEAAAAGLRVQNDLDVAPWPFCDVRGLGAALGADDDITIDINHADGRYTIGDPFSGSFVASGEGRLWVQVDLVQFDGQVLHVLPDLGRVRIAKAGERIAFGAPRGKPGYMEASDPPGRLTLLVIASNRPLPPPSRPGERAATYLPRLRQTLTALGATLTISTRDLIVSRTRS